MDRPNSLARDLRHNCTVCHKSYETHRWSTNGFVPLREELDRKGGNACDDS